MAGTLNTRKNNEANQKLLDKSLLNTKPYFVGDTSARTFADFGTTYAIQAIEDTTFTLLDTNCENESTTLQGKTLLAGHVWYLQIFSLTLATGSVFLHRQ